MLALLIALSLPATSPIMPGHGVGALKLGMTEAQVRAAGLPIKPGRFETERRVDQFDVRFKDGVVVAISLELGKQPQALHIGRTGVQSTSAQALAKATAGCGPLERRTGGNIIQCASGLLIAQHMGGLAVTVQAPATRSDAPVCDDYLEPGNPASKISVQPGKAYCLPSRVVTTKTVQADVLGALRYNTCQTQANRGATVVTCPYQGTRFIFAGPTLVLAEVHGVPLKQ